MKRRGPFPQTVGILGILSLLVATFIFANMQGGFVSWFLFYAFLIIAIYEIVVFVGALHGVKVERSFSSTRLNAGEKVDVKLRLTKPVWFPLSWVWLADNIPETMTHPQQRGERLLFPWWRREMTVSYVCDALPRGRHVWQGVTIQSGDLFGFVQREKEFLLRDEVLVYPKVRKIPIWQTVNERNTGITYTLNQASEDVTSVIGVRDYVHGDRLSRIHWKATAKGTGLKTKEFAFQTSNDMMFFLDRRQSVYSTGNEELFERAVSLVASLSRYAVSRHFPVGLVSYGKTRYVLGTNRHPDTLLHIFEHLAEIKADSTASFAQAILREVDYLPYGTTVICVTARLDQSVIDAITQLRTRRMKVELFWLTISNRILGEQAAWLRSLNQLHVPCKRVYHDRFEEFLRGEEIFHA